MKLALESNVPFLGELPVDPRVAMCGDGGEPIVRKHPDSPVAKAYRELAQSLKARQKKVALDTSGETLNHAIEALPTLIKPNIHELEALVKRPLPSREAVIEAARELVAQGIGTVVVSMGHEGACFVGSEGVFFATPPEIEVRSTVGAGDAMVAGMVSAKLRGLSLAEAARLSTAFSVRAIGKLDPELTVEALSEKVAITS